MYKIRKFIDHINIKETNIRTVTYGIWTWIEPIDIYINIHMYKNYYRKIRI